MGPYRFLILVVWCTVLETSHLPKTDNKPRPKMAYTKALNNTLQAIERLMSFYEEQIDQVNLDAIYGLRVAEGALGVSLTEYSGSFWDATQATKYFHQKISQLGKQAASINNRAQASIKEQASEYYYTFQDVVDKPWGFFKDFGQRKLPMTKVKAVNISGHKQTWDEEMSDRCMSEALGTNPNKTECVFTPLCVNTVTDQKQEGYGPTHQILFLTIAMIHKCQAKYSGILKQHIGLDMDGLVEDRCVRVMSEMIGLERPSVDKYARDLYMEQGFVCAMHGYEEFLSLKRLGNIVSWQRSVGCFGKQKQEDDSEDGEEKRGTLGDNEEQRSTRWDHEEKIGTLGDKVGYRRRRNVGAFRSMRRLLVDVTVGHGCSAHESGVAAGLLGLYARWLLTKLDTGLETPITAQNLGKRGTIPMTHASNSSTNINIKKPMSMTHAPNRTNINIKKLITDNSNKKNNNIPPVTKPITHETKTTSNKKSNPIPNYSNNNENNNKDNNNNSSNDEEGNKLSAKEIYIRAMVISFVTSLLTVAVVLLLYKLGEGLCSCHRSRKNYKLLNGALDM